MPNLKRVHRVQVSYSSNDKISVSNKPVSNLAMKIRRGARCYLYISAIFALLLILYVSDLTYISAVLNKKVPVHRQVVRWVDQEKFVDHRKPRMMITYLGRMGNHLYEYSTLLCLSRKYNMTPIISPDVDILDVFKLPLPQGELSLLRNPVTYKEELPAKYSKIVESLDPSRDTYLYGYYQSWRYFDEIREELLSKHFIYHDNIEKSATEYIAKVLKDRNKEGAQTISIHVRRGDFVRQRVKGYTVATIPYFYKAMGYFRKKYKNVMFIICTNDLVWAERNLDQGPDVHYSHETDGSLDLAIMTHCNHIIISSGTYSWWAGYLVRGEVIYYGGYPQPNTKIGNLTVKADYYPPYWKPLI